MTGAGLGIVQDLLSSRGDPRDLAPSQLAPLREFFEEESGAGLWFFCHLICGLTKLTPHLHYDVCTFLSRWGSPGWERLMLMVPRGTFKTSIGSKALPLWTATKNPETTVGIFNAAQEQAKDWVGSIRNILEGSLLYQQLWPERLPPGVSQRDRERGVSLPRSWHWGDSGLRLVRESRAVSEDTFEPYGIGGSSTGRHYSHRVMDDLIGETAAQSPLLIEDAIHFVDHARALERPPNGGFELINCTPWAYRDCYSHVLSKWPEQYKVYRRSLLEHPITGEPDVLEGESIFPEETSTFAARQMYEKDAFVFMSQYQCIPMSGRDVAFAREWIRPVQVVQKGGELYLEIPPEHYDPGAVCAAVAGEKGPNHFPLHWCDRAILIDPAPYKPSERTREPRARTGIAVVARDPWGRNFTLQTVGLREDEVTVLEGIVLLSQAWGVTKIGIEEVNFSSVYAPLWTAILSYKHPSIRFQWIGLSSKHQEKEIRIRAMIGPHREQLWYYNLVDSRQGVQEILEFPNGETRDIIDAQAYWNQALSRPETPEEHDRNLSSRWSSGRDKFTGY